LVVQIKHGVRNNSLYLVEVQAPESCKQNIVAGLQHRGKYLTKAQNEHDMQKCYVSAHFDNTYPVPLQTTEAVEMDFSLATKSIKSFDREATYMGRRNGASF
jgi:hypothetical protein